MTSTHSRIALFQQKEIRKIWHNEQWYFSVIDVVSALTESSNPRDYWYKMKIRVQREGEMELSTLCLQLKLESTDGKSYETDCANTEGIFRIIQSIPPLFIFTGDDPILHSSFLL
jgi:DNA-damage-inducible protein D